MIINLDIRKKDIVTYEPAPGEYLTNSPVEGVDPGVSVTLENGLEMSPRAMENKVVSIRRPGEDHGCEVELYPSDPYSPGGLVFAYAY